jgi:hypothetical protein
MTIIVPECGFEEEELFSFWYYFFVFEILEQGSHPAMDSKSMIDIVKWVFLELTQSSKECLSSCIERILEFFCFFTF